MADTNHNGNEPAHPSQYVDFSESAERGFNVVSNEAHGLTKREYFAAMAMQGIVARNGIADSDGDRINLVAESVLYADALLAELDEE